MQNEKKIKQKDNILFFLFLTVIAVPTIVYSGPCYLTYSIPRSMWFLAGFMTLVIITALRTSFFRDRKVIPPDIFTSPIFISIVAFCVCISLSTLFSSMPRISFLGSYWRQMGLIVMLPMITMTIIAMIIFSRDEKYCKRFFVFITCLGAFHGIVAVSQMPFFAEIINRPGEIRTSGLLGNPDVLAPFILLLFFPSLGTALWYLIKKKFLYGTLSFLSVLIQLTALMSSMVRGSWIALFSGVIFWTVITIFFIFRRHYKKIIAVSCFILSASILTIIFLEKTASRQPVYRRTAFDRLISIVTLKDKTGLPPQRLILWRDSLRLCRDTLLKGKIFGVGIENFLKPFLPYKSLRLAQISKTVIYDNPHNNYIGALAKTGIIGFTAYILIFIITSLALLQVLRKHIRNASLTDKLFVSSLFAGIIAYAVNLISIFETLATGIMFFVYLGLLIVLIRKIRNIQPFKENNTPLSLTSKAPLYTAILMLLSAFVLSAIGFIHYLRFKKADVIYNKGRKIVADVYLHDKHNINKIQKAIKYLDDAVKIYPYEAFYVNDLVLAMGFEGSWYSDNNQQKKAVKIFKKCLSLVKRYEKYAWSPDTLYLSAGSAAIEIGFADDAIEFFEKALKLDKWGFKAHSAIAGIALRKYVDLMKFKIIDIEALKKSFQHYYCTMLVLRYAPYWDKTSLKNLFITGKELFMKTQNQDIIKKMLTIALYAKAKNIPLPVNKKDITKLAKKTKYSKLANKILE